MKELFIRHNDLLWKAPDALKGTVATRVIYPESHINSAYREFGIGNAFNGSRCLPEIVRCVVA